MTIFRGLNTASIFEYDELETLKEIFKQLQYNVFVKQYVSRYYRLGTKW